MKFDLTKFKNTEFVVRCETENDFYNFIYRLINMKIMDSNEIRFMSWSDYGVYTCVLYDGEVLYGESDDYAEIVNYKDLVFDANSDIPELCNGMIVETREGILYVVATSYKGNKFFMGANEWDSLNNYNNNLKNSYDKLLDIIAIYKPVCALTNGFPISFLVDKTKDWIEPIWKRDEQKKMTLTEISETLGYDVEVIDNE